DLRTKLQPVVERVAGANEETRIADEAVIRAHARRVRVVATVEPQPDREPRERTHGERERPCEADVRVGKLENVFGVSKTGRCAEGHVSPVHTSEWNAPKPWEAARRIADHVRLGLLRFRRRRRLSLRVLRARRRCERTNCDYEEEPLD